MKKRWAAEAGMALYTQSMMDSARAGMGIDANYNEMGGVHNMRPLPGHFYPEGMDMYPLPGKAAAGGTFYELGGVNSMTQPLPGYVDMNGNELEPLAGNFDTSMKDVTPLPGKAKSGIYIKPSKRGTFTAAAKKRGKGVQEFASQVLANKENYSPAMVKKANFARNAAGWKKGQAGLTAFGGPELGMDYTASFGMYNQSFNAPATPPPGYIPNMQGFIPDIDMNNQFLVDNKITQPTAADLEKQRQRDLFAATGVGYSNVPSRNREIDAEIQKQYDTDKAFKRKYDKSLPGPQIPQPEKVDYVTPALGVAAALTSQFASEPTPRRYNRPEDQLYYNPNPAGTGSQALFEQGGWIGETNGVEYPYESGLMFKAGGEMIRRKDGSYSRRGLWDNIRANRGSGKKPTKEMLKQERKIRAAEKKYDGGEIMNVADLNNPIARMGGSIRMNYNDMSAYEEGGELSLYDDTQGAQPISENPYTSEMVQFDGEYHGESNDVGTEGIPINYGGTDVEVEHGETAFKDQEGNFQILGNMKNPMTGRKFKKDGEKIAEAERKANKMIKEGLRLINDSDDILKNQAGEAKVSGGKKKLKDLAALRETIVDVQQAKLDMAASMGVEPMELENKAMFGRMMKAQDGATFENSTLNPAVNTANLMQRFYADPYFGANIKDLQEVVVTGKRNPTTTTAPTNTSTPKGSGKKKASGTASSSASSSSAAATTSPMPDGVGYSKDSWKGTKFPVPEMPSYLGEEAEAAANTPAGVNSSGAFNATKPLTSDVEPFDYTNIIPELYALATNKISPIYMQKINPELKQPFRVSFQNQLNKNQANFNAMLREIGDNPNAQSILAAQKYAADQDVLDKEMQYNQQIEAGIYNANRDAIYDARLRNVAMNQEQARMQEMARVNTQRRAFDALSSIVDKKLADKAQKNTLKVMENLYKFRFGKDYVAQSQNPAEDFSGYTPIGYNPETGKPRTIGDSAKKKATKTATASAGKSLIRQFKTLK
jgi:hypothetical protein